MVVLQAGIPNVENRQNPSIMTHPSGETLPGGLYKVLILDNDTNTYEEVISVCMKALGVTFDEAFQIALAVDNNGEAEVFRGSESEADEIARIIRRIGIEVKVIPL